MKVRLIWPGKTRQAWIRKGIEVYVGRIGAFVPTEICETPEARKGPPVARRREEGRRLVERLSPVGYTVVLDEEGRSLSSAAFARMVGERMLEGRDLCFLIGGAEGLPPAVRERADLVLSLSSLTLPHDLARLVLVEQIYRALAILKDHPYPR